MNFLNFSTVYTIIGFSAVIWLVYMIFGFSVVRYIWIRIRRDQFQRCNKSQEGKGNFWRICYQRSRCSPCHEDWFTRFTVLSARGLVEKPSHSGSLSHMSKSSWIGTILVALFHITNNHVIRIFTITFPIFQFTVIEKKRF